MSLFTPRGIIRPPLSTPLTGSHPCVSGLWAAWYGLESGGVTLWDSAQLRPGAITGTLVRDPRGGYVHGASTSDYGVWSTGHQFATCTHAALLTYTGTGGGPVSIMAETPGNNTRDRALQVNGSDQPEFYIWDGAGRTVTSSVALQVGGTYLLVGRSDGATLKIFVNGTEVGSIAAGTAFQTFSSPELVLGYGTSLSRNAVAGFYSLHAHLVWQRVLSAAEILLLSRDPYGLLASPSWPWLDIVAAAGGSWGPLLGLRNNRLVRAA